MLLEFTMAFDLVVINSYFRKREEHLVTFGSVVGKIHINYFIFKRMDLLACRDYKIIPNK